LWLNKAGQSHESSRSICHSQYQAVRDEIFGKQKAQVKDADLYDLLFRYGNAAATEQK